MREFVLGLGEEPLSTDIEFQFDVGPPLRIDPVGTKFLRRVAVLIPVGARELKLRFRRQMWLVRRMWIGTSRPVDSAMQWRTPIAVRGPATNALGLMATVDRQRLVLNPQQAIEVEFLPAEVRSDPAKMGYVLRMMGYYEFQHPAGIETR